MNESALDGDDDYEESKPNLSPQIQPKTKKLFILNQNEIVLAELFRRPYSKQFLGFCLQRFEVGVWSSARGYNIDGALKCAMGNHKEKLLFVWVGLIPMVNAEKPLYMKELQKVWNLYDSIYSRSNTLMIDDKPYRALYNPAHLSIFTKSYDINDEEDNLFDPNGELCKYLEGVYKAEDVPRHIQHNPFGLPPITPSHPDWKYYKKVQNIGPSASVLWSFLGHSAEVIVTRSTHAYCYISSCA
ncbi:hypothetical protein KIW84_045726 [Lathyrus oleraceus]|uniref:Mitochondrial import inner membrane translocase subunit TIM50 n=1 Tax=Pisum sativum TaxID=3888 RepID=A0A9D4XJA1_PEA|nr:hypothetical protein KIW84_045726 [Pisum sativum]